jgi:hypothetical protein
MTACLGTADHRAATRLGKNGGSREPYQCAKVVYLPGSIVGQVVHKMAGINALRTGER